ncbi:cadherin-like beta sandwich domain-containing protein [Paenibacillus sp. GCM10027626]|uniref:cadherin-like beta sandwich domain-containing protein n=1 Tax=Paenibacillus sp. GCM10027626 TaxID=3273411 RepID=UPI00362E56BD
MHVQRSKYDWKKQLSLLLVFVMAAGGFLGGFAANKVQAADDGVAISASEGKTTYVVNGDAVTIDNDLSLNYNENLKGASVVIANFKSDDLLGFINTAKITGNYNKTNGVLTLTGEATVKEYEAALRSVTLTTTGADLSDRVIQFTLGTALPFSNGHFYEYIKTSTKISWDNAKVAAENLNYFGRQGYLVTITSEEENTFVKEKTQGLGWIGAQDIERKNGEPQNTGDWRWVTGPEGLEDNGKGLKFYQGYQGAGAGPFNKRYNNWQSGEPNNYDGVEYVAHIFGPGTTAGLWNDFSPTNASVFGYVVEYGGMPGDKNIKISAEKTVAVIKVDKSALLKEINESNKAESNKEKYTVESFGAFERELAEAQKVFNNKNATQAEVDEATAKLNEARLNLVKREPRLTDLNLTVADATYKNPSELAGKEIQLSPEQFNGKNRLNYNATVTDDVYSVAIIPIAVDGATITVKLRGEEYVGDERNNIPLEVGENVIEVTVTLDNGEENIYTFVITKVDKTALREQVAEIDKLNKDVYTPESWNKLQEALKKANEVLSNQSLMQSQEEIDKALADLKAAKDALVVDKSKLQARVDDSKKLIEADYTPESWKQLQDALTEAQKVLDDQAATPEQIAKALANLNQAYDKLQKTGGALSGVKLKDPKTGKDIEMSPKFNSNELDYKAVVPNEVSAISLDPKALHPDGEVKVTLNGKEVDPKDWNNLPLQEGLNIIKVEVTDPTTGEPKTYTLEIMRTTNKLIDLKPSTSSLNPAFDSEKDAYTMSVPNSVDELKFTPTALDPEAKIEISVGGGKFVTVGSGKESTALPLNVGDNEVIVKVTDRDGKVKEYKVKVNRASASDSGWWIPAPGPGPSTTGNITTSVDGTNNNFATGTTKKDGDNEVTTVQVDAGKLNDILADGKAHQLAIRVPGEGKVEVNGLTAAVAKKLADTGSTLNIENLLAIYPVPGKQLDLDAIAKQWNGAKLEDIALKINIERSSQELIDLARSQAKAKGYELLVDPVNLDLTFTYDGKTVRAGQLEGYATKYIALPEGIDPNRITTGVVVNPDGTTFHLPTVVTKINNRYFAQINDLRSSGTYSVIWNPQDFDDVKKHWAQSNVNNIAARLQLKGTGNNTYSPNRNVNRSEFASIVMLGMGLMRQEVPQNMFSDVSQAQWYHNAVTIANEFGIVLGYSDGLFRGEREITREQGIAMIARAYQLAAAPKAMSEAEIAATLAGFGDADKVSKWAKESVAQMVAAGIIEGKGAKLLNPQASMTRAEATAMMERLLKTTNLID